MKKNPDQSATEFATESATRLQEPKVVAVKQWAEAPRFNISPDGQAMTVLFDALVAELPADGEAIATTVAVLQIPIHLPMPLTETHLGLSVVLRGFLDKPEGAYASIHIELGGVSKTFEYSQDTAINLDLQYNLFRFTEKSPADHLTAVLSLTLNRVGPSGVGGFIKLDSLNVEINKLQKLAQESSP